MNNKLNAIEKTRLSNSNSNELSEVINDDLTDYILELSDPPIFFEHVTSSTKIFYDKDNQQIYCVRSNGVGGIIVKGPKPESNLTFRLSDKGDVASIKFSPNMSILGIIRTNNKCIEFLNFKNGQPDVGEYFLPFKNKTSMKFQDFYWIDSNNLLVASEQDFEHYQIFPDKRSLKLLKTFPIQSNWIIWSREMQILVASTSHLGSILNPFIYFKNQFLKLPKFEVDLPLNLNVKNQQQQQQQQQRNCLNESDVVVVSIYNDYYVMVIRQITTSTSSNTSMMSMNASRQSIANNRGYSEIVMYKLQSENPAKKTNILRINLNGRFLINIVDDLIVVHHQLTKSSLIYDIKMKGESDGYVTFNNPIIQKAKIKTNRIPKANLSMHNYDRTLATNVTSLNSTNFYDDQDLFLSANNSEASSLQSSNSSSPTGHESQLHEIETYSKSWIIFLPNVIIDTKLCCFWFLKLRLNNIQILNELNNNKLMLVEFLLNRKNSKKLLINACYDAITLRLNIKQIAMIFDKINQFYKIVMDQYAKQVNSLNSSDTMSGNISLNLNNSNSLLNSISLLNTSGSNNVSTTVATSSLSSLLLPVIEQYDMYNEILYPLFEDENWWNTNINYTLAILVEYFRSLNSNEITVEHYLYKLFVDVLIKSNKLYTLHQYLQYHVLSDSKPLACLLLGLQKTYPASNQLALDMLKRLETANEEIVDVLLSKGLVLSALRFAQSVGISDSLNPRTFLEVAKDLNDSLIFYTVFKYFEERNIKLRGNPLFKPEENCDIYLRHFTHLFQNSQISSN